MDKFVKEVTTKSVAKVIDGCGPEFINMSVLPNKDGSTIELVIGAKSSSICGASLSKTGLQFLINTLQDVHDGMTVR